jgi:hypothetical protein
MANRIDAAGMMTMEEDDAGTGPQPLRLNSDGSLPDEFRQTERSRAIEAVAARAKKRGEKATR